jgi:hypothetical protein
MSLLGFYLSWMGVAKLNGAAQGHLAAGLALENRAAPTISGMGVLKCVSSQETSTLSSICSATLLLSRNHIRRANSGARNVGLARTLSYLYGSDFFLNLGVWQV